MQGCEAYPRRRRSDGFATPRERPLPHGSTHVMTRASPHGSANLYLGRSSSPVPSNYPTHLPQHFPPVSPL